MKKTTCVLILFSLLGCNSIHRLSVPFADPKTVIENAHINDGVIRIFFDRNGFIYPDAVPDATITDTALMKCDSRLASFYQSYPAVYDKICNANGVTPISELDSLNARVDPLQKRLINGYISRINTTAVQKTIVFLIHGCNEHPVLSPDHYNAAKGYQLTRDSLTAQFPAKHLLFVEIYWDGLSIENGSHFLPTLSLNTLKIWKNAQVGASYAGLELRRILSGLQNDTIHVITHGDGAGLITNALFNVLKSGSKQNSNPDRWEYEINNCLNSRAYKTPAQQFYIGMLAPAIPGINVFKEYHRRTVGGKDTDVPLNNYHFILGFNKFDRVTSKFRLAAKCFGSTTLACKSAELNRTRQLFNNDPSIIDYVDFSYYNNRDKQVEHGWRFYLSHAPQITDFFNRSIR